MERTLELRFARTNEAKASVKALAPVREEIHRSPRSHLARHHKYSGYKECRLIYQGL